MWHFCKGYVILQIEGMAIARFLRRIADSGIRIAKLCELSPGVVRFEVEARRFFALHRLRQGLPIRIRIVQKRGLPFAARRIRCRPVLWMGSILVLTALFFASQRIWMIRIEGAERIESETILSLMSEHGLHVGASIKGPVLITAANDLSARIPEAAWIGMDREGIMLKVSVVEATPESEKRIGSAPSDLVADRDGVITGIVVMRGQACVHVGDTVHAGDILISGTVTHQDASYGTWADGIVYCAIPYEAECEVKETVVEAIQTDRSETVRTIRIGPWTLLQSGPTFEHYRLTDRRDVPVGDRFPSFSDTYTAWEIIFRERALDEEEAEQLALMNAREQALDSVPKDASILNQYGMIRIRDGKPYAVVIVTAEETIGRTEEQPNDG